MSERLRHLIYLAENRYIKPDCHCVVCAEMWREIIAALVEYAEHSENGDGLVLVKE
jgi:hypothetical protein